MLNLVQLCYDENGRWEFLIYTSMTYSNIPAENIRFGMHIVIADAWIDL